jgi:hypothetical protein
MPSAPPLITGVWPAGLRKLTISGVTTAGINGDVIYCGLIAGYHSWSTDGSQTSGASNTIVSSSGTVWTMARGASYSATKTSSATDPTGLTSWTVGTGTGSPTVAAAAQTVPPVVYASPGNTPSAPPIITA